MSDLARISAYGPGIKNALCLQPTHFNVRAPRVPTGKLRVSMEGPSKPSLHLHNNNDGTYSGTYTVSIPGDYKLSIMAGDDHISGSPFNVYVHGEGVQGDASSVRLSGDAYHFGRVGVWNEFYANIEKAGNGKLGLAIEGPHKAQIKCDPADSGVFLCGYKPDGPGKYRLNVRFEGVDVPDSPFTIQVQ